MKIAVAGKGGSGKTTVSGTLARLLAENGGKVFAIDADPNTNMASVIGFTYEEAESFVPLTEMTALIEERTGVKKGAVGAYFKLNPEVDDIPDRYKQEKKGVMLLVTGAMKEPGAGCYCPENAFLKSLLINLFMKRDEIVVLDMEAGFEHLTRGTMEAVDAMVIVVEPSKRSTLTAKRISTLAQKLGIRNLYLVGNKVDSPEEKAFLKEEMKGNDLLGYIPLFDDVRAADMKGEAPVDVCPLFVNEIKQVMEKLLAATGTSGT